MAQDKIPSTPISFSLSWGRNGYGAPEEQMEWVMKIVFHCGKSRQISWARAVRKYAENWFRAWFLDQKHLGWNPVLTTYYHMTLDKLLKSIIHLLMTHDYFLMGLLGELNEILSKKL